MAPWIFLLFIGTFDFGFYVYAAICTQNAARAAAMANSLADSPADQTDACTMVLQEMNSLPNVTLGTGCSSTLGVTDANPIAVVVAQVTGPDSNPNVLTVTVQYLSIQLFPIPGLMGKMTMTRTVEVPELNP